MITWLGGRFGMPMALRRIESTTTMRVKLVANMRMAGTSDSTVMATRSCKDNAIWPLPLEAWPSPTLTEMSDEPLELQPATMKTVAATSKSRRNRRRFI